VESNADVRTMKQALPCLTGQVGARFSESIKINLFLKH
jgi:hypothetical protein